MREWNFPIRETLEWRPSVKNVWLETLPFHITSDSVSLQIYLHFDMYCHVRSPHEYNFFLDDGKHDHSEYEGFVGVIYEGKIYVTDGHTDVNDIINCFCSNRCPPLDGKPKMFFIQVRVSPFLEPCNFPISIF